MPRYTRISDDDADDDSVALIMGQNAPRLSRFGATEYIRLENIDDGEEDESEQQLQQKIHKKFANVRKSSGNMMKYIFLAIFGLVIFSACISLYKRRHASHDALKAAVLSEPLDPETTFSNGTHTFKRTTLMISLDGMHPHYLSVERTPRLNRMSRSAFITPFMRPSFPTQTFPNHWTLVTGMYPANHGIVGNTFYDPELDMEFVNTDPEKSLNRRFWGGEPVWASAKKQGLKTAVHMWPGSEADWGDDAPDEVDPFNGDEALGKKVDRIVEWLDREEPPRLMLTYVPTVDTAGHKSGISGPALRNALSNVDHFVGQVIDALTERNLTDIVNLVVVSDHGMAPISDERLVFVDNLVTNYDQISSNLGWPLAAIRFNTTEEVAEAMNSLTYYQHRDGAPVPGFKPYTIDSMPAHWHFGLTHGHQAGQDQDQNQNQEDAPSYRGQYFHRLAPLYIVPEPGWTLVTTESLEAMGGNLTLKGIHGYDNDAPLMRALFVAQGPAFPKGKYVPFDNIDVYSAICRSLGFEGSEEADGRFRGIKATSPMIRENYPGVKFDTEFLKESTFSEFYENWT